MRRSLRIGILCTFVLSLVLIRHVCAFAAAPEGGAAGQGGTRAVPGAPRQQETPDFSVVSLYNQANGYIQRKQYTSAERFVDEALRIDPAYFPLWLQKAQILTYTQRQGEAEQAIRVYLDRNPSDVKGLVLAIEMVLTNPNLTDESRAQKLQNTLSGAPDQRLADILYELLQINGIRLHLPVFLSAWKSANLGLPTTWTVLDLYARRDRNRAVSTLSSAVGGTNPPPVPLLGALYYLLGVDIADRNGDQNAITLFERAQGSGFPAERCAEMIGETHFKHNRFKEAADVWETQWRNAEDPEQWVVRIANARFESGELEKAADILLQGVNTFPKSAVIQGKYIYALYKLDKKEEQESFELRLDGLNAQVGLAYGRALVFLDERRPAQAQEQMNKAVLFAEASTGERFTGTSIESWLASMERTGGTGTAEAQDEALRLRDQGWNYWQEREYRKAYEVWMEAIDLGFPQVRPFIMNITTQLFEVGMTREAIQLLNRHLPNVTPFAFAHQMAQIERWDAVLPILSASPSNQFSPWNVLYRTYAALVIGKTDVLLSGMEQLSKLPQPTRTLAVTGLDDQGRFTRYSLTPARYANLLSNFGKVALTQRTPQILLQLMNFPQWQGIAGEERARMLAEAAQEIVRQSDFSMLQTLLMSSEWSQLPPDIRAMLLTGGAREMLRLRDIPSLLNYIELPQWRELPREAQDELILAAGDEIIRQNAAKLFPLFMEDPHWQQLPDERRADQIVQAGKLLHQYELDDSAFPYFMEASRIDPSNGTAFSYMALIEKQRGNHDQAKAYLEQALAGRISEADREYAQAIFAYEDGDGPGASNHFLAYLKLVPNDHFARYRTINLLTAQHRNAEARMLKDGFEKMYQENVPTIETYVGLTRQEFGEAQAAEPVWAKLVGDYPEEVGYKRNLGISLNTQGKFELAIDLLSEPSRSTGDVQLTRVVTEAYFGLAKYEDVLEWAALGLETDPEELQLLRLGAEAAEALGRYETAEEYAYRYTQLEPSSASLQGLYGRSLMAQRKWDEIHSHDIDRLDGNPSNEVVLKNESEYAKAKYGQYAGTRKIHEYLRMDRKTYRKVLNHYRQDPVNWSNYAVAAAGDSYFHGAIPAMEHLYDMSPNQTVAVLRYPQISMNLSEIGIPLARVREQIDILLAAGHTVVRPEDIPLAAEPGRMEEDPVPIPLVLLFSRMDKDTLANLDALLEERGICASLVIGEDSLYPQTRAWADQVFLAELAGTGRWTFLITDYTTRTVRRSASGETGPFWGTPRWLGERAENEEEMYHRWRDEMARLKDLGASAGIPITGWVYPLGDYGQLTVEGSGPENRAYKRAVEEVFTLGFASTNLGFWAPYPDLWRLPMRSIYLGTDTLSLLRSLTRDQPTLQSTLEFAKILSWNGQFPRADRLFQRAEATNLDLKEIYYFHARNSQFAGDIPVAMDFARKAEEVDPENPRVEDLSRDIKSLMRPQLSLTPSYSWDSDDRDYYDLEARYSQYVNERTMLFGGMHFSRWVEPDQDSLSGYTPFFGIRRHVKPEHWLEASVGLTIFDDGDIDPVPNLGVTWHGPVNQKNSWHANGSYELSYGYGRVDTIEALDGKIQSHTLVASTNLRVNDFWDVDARLFGSRYTDDNYAYGGSLRALYRLREKPLLRGGFLVEAADSKFDAPQYYTPLEYIHYAAVLDFRYFFRPDLYLNLYGTFGRARSETTDWHNVWRAYGDLNWRFSEDWGISFGYRHLELPTYMLDEIRGTLFHVF